jgi:predicted metalloprotease with PDZ domain
MNTPDFQTPMNMELLWVYEGLTKYLGMMLAARSGLMSADYFKQQWALDWGNLRHTAGRQWRPLRDVAVTTQTIWGGSESWSFHRRGADYYSEGALLWLEVDSRIRELSSGKRSLDDFCKSFFGTGDRDAHSISFEKRDMVSALTELADFAWDSLFTERISRTGERLDESPLAAAGYKFAYTTEKPKALSDTESRRECRYFYESVGFAVADEDNRILQVVPGSPADKAGLYTRMNILGVNAKTFSIDRLEKAIRDAVKTGEITLLVQRGESLNQVTLQYQEGLRYLTIVPTNSGRQWLDEIIKPRSSQ